MLHVKPDPKDQPSLDEKVRTLEGQDTGWDYLFAVPPFAHGLWTNDDWIRYIGDNWIRKVQA